MAFDAASYLVMALSLWSVRDVSKPAARSGRGRSRSERRASGGAGFRAVVRLAATNAVLRDTTIMFALFNVGEGALMVFLPHRAQMLGLGTGGYGYLMRRLCAQAVIGAAHMPRATSAVTVTAAEPTTSGTITRAAAICAVTIETVSGARHAIRVSSSAASSSPAVLAATRLVPPEAHGRLFALLRTAMQATPPVGAALAALVIGRGAVVTVAAIATVIAVPAIVLARDLLGTPSADREPVPTGTVNDSALADAALAGEVNRF